MLSRQTWFVSDCPLSRLKAPLLLLLREGGEITFCSGADFWGLAEKSRTIVMDPIGPFPSVFFRER